MDPRIDRTAAIRYRLREMLIEFMKSPNVQQVAGDSMAGGPPFLPLIPGVENSPRGQQAALNGGQQFSPQRYQTGGPGGPQLPQLPPLSFGGETEHPQDLNRPLTPITEGGSVMTHPIGTSGDNQQQSTNSTGFSPRSPQQPQRQLSSAPSQDQPAPSQPTYGQNDQSPVLGRDLNQSPMAMSPSASYTTASTSMYAASGVPLPLESSTTQPSLAGVVPPIGRSSVDSNRTNGSGARVPLGSPTKIQGPPLTLSPNRRGDSVSNHTLPSPPPPVIAKDSPPEVSQDGLEDEGMFNQHNTLRAELQQPKLAAPIETPPLQPSSSTGHRNDDLVNEAGVMFFMQEENGRVATQPARQPVQFDDEERDGYDSSSDIELSSRAAQKQKAPLSSIASDATSLASSNSQRQPVRQNTPMAFSDARVGGAAGDVSNKGPSPIPSPTFAVNTPSYATEAPSRPAVDRGYAPTGRPALGRKPSGARAPQPIPKGFSSGQVAGYSSSSPLPSQLEASEDEEAEEALSSNRQHTQLPAHQDRQGQKSPTMVSTSSAAAPVVQKQGIDAGYDDDNVEALAALAYLDVSEPLQQSAIPPSDSLTSSNGGPPIVTIEPLQGPSASTSSDLSSGSGIKSSFAPSRQAEERKKKAQAQQAAQQAAVTKPGRANGRKRTAAAAAGAWGESSDEDEEEEDDEDEDVDSDGEPAHAPPPPRMQQQQQQQAAAMHQPFPQSSVYPSVGGASPAEAPSSSYTHIRPPRTLPQPPSGSRPGACCAPF